MSDFCNILKELRLKFQYTQEEMAKKLGVSKSTISMYENGNREPDFETLEAIADLFNVDMNYLYGRQSNASKNLPTAAYYLDDEAAVLAQEIYENPELRMLMDASRKVSKEDLQFVVDMIKRLKD